MKASQLQTKRVAKKARFRLLHARIAGRKQRVAATASPTTHLDADEPNLSVGRALIVILLIHIVAIGGIFFHNHFIAGKSSEATVVAPQPAAGAVAAVVSPEVSEEVERLPILRHGDQPYIVQTGDTYARIAAARGVAEEDLRRINENIPLRSGRILKMPGRRIVAIEPTEMGQIRATGHTSAERGNIEGLTELLAANANAAASNAESMGSEPAPPRAIVVNQGAAAAGGVASSHVVVSGDTLWRIANTHKITADELMKANGIDDPKKLKLGMTLKVPAPR